MHGMRKQTVLSILCVYIDEFIVPPGQIQLNMFIY